MIEPSWGLPPRRRQRWGESRSGLGRQVGATRLRATSDVATDLKPRPRPCGSPGSPAPSAMPPGRLRSPLISSSAWLEIATASVPDALPKSAARRSSLAGGHCETNEERAMPQAADTDRRSPVGQTPCHGEVAAVIAATSAAPKGRRSPQLGLIQQFRTCMVNSPIRFMALSSSACMRIALASPSEASIRPPTSLSHRHARAGSRSSTPASGATA